MGTGDLPGTDELDAEALDAAQAAGAGTTIGAATSSQSFVDTITEAIKETNADTTVVPNNASKIQKWTILPLDFSVETEELTPTFKLKRSFVHGKYEAVIDTLYSTKGDSPFIQTLREEGTPGGLHSS